MSNSLDSDQARQNVIDTPIEVSFHKVLNDLMIILFMLYRHLEKSVFKIVFLISQPKHYIVGTPKKC